MARIAPLAMLLVGCAATAPRSEPEESVTVSVQGTELIYDGPLTYEGNARLFEAAASAAERPQTLVITSTGGDVEVGMQLGTWIFEQQLDVHVPDYCISSCANYVFTAGRRKVLGREALLIWHGGATQEGLADASPCESWEVPGVPCDERQVEKLLQETLARTKRLETAFFARIGVEQEITVLGQRPEYECSKQLPRLGWYEYIGWYYSIADMETLGVTNVSVAGGKWQPAAPFPYVKFCRVVL